MTWVVSPLLTVMHVVTLLGVSGVNSEPVALDPWMGAARDVLVEGATKGVIIADRVLLDTLLCIFRALDLVELDMQSLFDVRRIGANLDLLVAIHVKCFICI